MPAVPIYIQEKIHPQAIIEDLRADRGGRRRRARARPVRRLQRPGRSSELVEFYQHDQHWTNRLILGDCLLVMTSLAEKEGLKGKVQMIYFDPPYGIKFGSNWQVSTRKRDVKDGKAEDLTRQPEQIKAFRDTWELGIHCYLTYLRDRLAAARDLLTESGSIFVQIGDENVHLVRCAAGRGVRQRELRQPHHVQEDGRSDRASYLPGTVRLHALVCEGPRRDEVPASSIVTKAVGGVGGGQYTWIELPMASDAA